MKPSRYGSMEVAMPGNLIRPAQRPAYLLGLQGTVASQAMWLLVVSR